MKATYWVFLNSSIVFLIISIALYASDVGTQTINNLLANRLSLRPENEAVYSAWKTSATNSELNIYLWHIENPAEFYNGSRPKLVEVGPFCYRKVARKVQIRHDQDGKVRYQTQRFYYEERRWSQNCLDVNTEVTSINVAYPLVMGALKDMTDAYKTLFMGMIPPGWGLFVHKPAKELIWGYDDNVLEMLKPYLFGLSQYGHFAERNGSFSNEVTIENGYETIEGIGRLTAWGQSQTLEPLWYSDAANRLFGVDASSMAPIQYSPGVSEIDMFYDRLCRTLTYTTRQESAYVGPLQSTKFALREEFLRSGDVYGANSGYCPRTGCLPSGLLALDTCSRTYPIKLSLPLVMSKPHLLHADARIRAAIIGMFPSADYHQSHLFFHQSTGSILRSELNLQMNVQLDPVSNPQGERLIFPLYWTAQVSEAPPQFLTFLNSAPFINFEAIRQWPIALVAFGVLCNIVVWSIIFTMKQHHHLSKQFHNNISRNIFEKFAENTSKVFNNSKVSHASKLEDQEGQTDIKPETMVPEVIS